MLITPLAGKFRWEKIPYITILILSTNCFVFFFLNINNNHLVSQSAVLHHGLPPDRPAIVTAFSQMFIHGNLLHLAGNMIFLWLVGCILESGCGRIFYSVLYLVTGLAAAGLFTFINGTYAILSIGASGAISGLMGAYAVTFGLKKIRIFYFLGFYFAEIKISAPVLLFFWIAYEFLNLFFVGQLNVIYSAHIGGLLGGAVIGSLNAYLFKNVDSKVFVEIPQEKILPFLKTAMQHMEKLDMQEAKRPLNQILRIDPDNRIALRYLFGIEKLKPGSDLFHHTASRLLASLSDNRGERQTAYEIYKEYRGLCKEPVLDVDLLYSLGTSFSSPEYLEDAEEIVDLALKKAPQHPQAPAVLYQLATANAKCGQIKRSHRLLNMIYDHYPNSKEYKVAARLLKKNST